MFVVQAAGVFAATNVDDLLLLALYFGRGGPAWRVVVGQYAGFAAILAVSVLGALGAGLLPEAALPYLGLLPLALGLRAAWQVWRSRGDDDAPRLAAPSVVAVAAVTFANGGDNIGVYVPVFATSGPLWGYAAVFLVLVGAWCAAGRLLATRPPVARALARWGHLVLPVVLVGIGVAVLIGV